MRICENYLEQGGAIGSYMDIPVSLFVRCLTAVNFYVCYIRPYVYPQSQTFISRLTTGTCKNMIIRRRLLLYKRQKFSCKSIKENSGYSNFDKVSVQLLFYLSQKSTFPLQMNVKRDFIQVADGSIVQKLEKVRQTELTNPNQPTKRASGNIRRATDSC